MGRFVSEDQISLYKDFVEGIREDLGRNVTLHIPGPPIKCPNCLFDPVNKRSTNVYSPSANYPATTPGPKPFKGGLCPVCNGTGQYTTETTKVIKCLIRWLKSGDIKYHAAGIEEQNDYRLKAAIEFEDDFRRARIVEIDGVPTEVTNIVERGLRDLIQIVVMCKRSEWPEGKRTDVSRF